MLSRLHLRSLYTLANGSKNLGAKRDVIYGVEEGHGQKNEVRKDKWIKKRQSRMQPRGTEWRVSQGYEKNQADGFLLTVNNWSDVDTGLPGCPSPQQKLLKEANVRLAQEIFEAAMLVQRAKSFPTE